MLNLDLIKLHCRIDSDDEDELLESYVNSAKSYIQSQLNRKLHSESVPASDPTGILINPSIQQAMLMIIAHWYEHRESVVLGSVTSKEIEDGAWRLIQPFRIMGV
ncbi:head-tail connector protein [Pasteurella multocida]|uniref:head-tail connector protein n=1 Tax=Pasteurella multocida TaxID=747 RepID=UPI0020258EA0|nr:head-tail connector protein [Pasteurella multocida]URJ84948.1 head-tail connector protein [Pasteurella multocida]HDR1007467.1 phage gp6-like head-tail connector protein [Pasteurella multocida]HDR1190955.1 phage gp6-like head-tail connector protein [Pasteurella multocida]HDR1193184.1 phage gp6-like head-tail connector protein [Pasteurella multocida]HDR1200510.1 phage gp6-like head-tail connector protein [Pasteurella multocida]